VCNGSVVQLYVRMYVVQLYVRMYVDIHAHVQLHNTTSHTDHTHHPQTNLWPEITHTHTHTDTHILQHRMPEMTTPSYHCPCSTKLLSMKTIKHVHVVQSHGLQSGVYHRSTTAVGGGCGLLIRFDKYCTLIELE